MPKARTRVPPGPGLGRIHRSGPHDRIPENVRRVLCASSLIPLRKKDGGVRPIAVGVRRVVGKCLLRSEAVTMELASLQPRQCGVGVRNAAEMVGMGLQRLVQSRHATGANDNVVLQVDMRNAFNSSAGMRCCASAWPRCPRRITGSASATAGQARCTARVAFSATATSGCTRVTPVGPWGLHWAWTPALTNANPENSHGNRNTSMTVTS